MADNIAKMSYHILRMTTSEVQLLTIAIIASIAILIVMNQRNQLLRVSGVWYKGNSRLTNQSQHSESMKALSTEFLISSSEESFVDVDFIPITNWLRFCGFRNAIIDEWEATYVLSPEPPLTTTELRLKNITISVRVLQWSALLVLRCSAFWVLCKYNKQQHIRY